MAAPRVNPPLCALCFVAHHDDTRRWRSHIAQPLATMDQRDLVLSSMVVLDPNTRAVVCRTLTGYPASADPDGAIRQLQRLVSKPNTDLLDDLTGLSYISLALALISIPRIGPCAVKVAFELSCH